MALIHALTSNSPLLFYSPSKSFSTKSPNLSIKTVKFPVSVTPFRCLPPERSFLSKEDVVHTLLAMAELNDKLLPAVRTYENDLARLTLVGVVDCQQAITAAAADGGRAADEHIAEGVPSMVVETVFPGSPDDRSTTSTRLVSREYFPSL